MFKEELLFIVSQYSVSQLADYIEKLEGRIKDTRTLIIELKLLLRKKQGRKPVDTGARDGR